MSAKPHLDHPCCPRCGCQHGIYAACPVPVLPLCPFNATLRYGDCSGDKTSD